MKICFGLLPVVAMLSCNVETTVHENEPAFEEATTRKVLEHHWETFGDNDLEGVMADYDESSVLVTPDRTYVGLAAIRQNFENAFAFFPRDSTEMTLQKTVIEGDIAYIIWSARAPRLNLKFGTDTFIIRNGKIIRQTYAGVPGE